MSGFRIGFFAGGGGEGRVRRWGGQSEEGECVYGEGHIHVLTTINLYLS